jgi:invasion protein IalB
VFNSTNWFGYVSAGILVAISAASAFLNARYADLPKGLKPIALAKIEPGFAGNHTYGVWTLFCRPDPAKAAAAAAAAPAGSAPEAEAPTTPDLGVGEGSPTAANAPRCLTNARVQVRQGNQPPRLVAGFNVLLRGPEQKPFVVFRLPPGAKGENHIFFAVDGNKAYKAPVAKCDEKQCFVRGELPAGAINQMLSGRELRVRFFLPDKKPVVLAQLLYGFKESYDGMKAALAKQPS